MWKPWAAGAGPIDRGPRSEERPAPREVAAPRAQRAQSTQHAEHAQRAQRAQRVAPPGSRSGARCRPWRRSATGRLPPPWPHRPRPPPPAACSCGGGAERGGGAGEAGCRRKARVALLAPFLCMDTLLTPHPSTPAHHAVPPLPGAPAAPGATCTNPPARPPARPPDRAAHLNSGEPPSQTAQAEMPAFQNSSRPLIGSFLAAAGEGGGPGSAGSAASSRRPPLCQAAAAACFLTPPQRLLPLQPTAPATNITTQSSRQGRPALQL